jgi:hypothetical protein
MTAGRSGRVSLALDSMLMAGTQTGIVQLRS